MEKNINEKEKNKAVEYFLEELVLAYPDRDNYGFEETEITARIRDAQTKGGKQYRKVILKKGNVVIAETNVHGEVKFTDEYLDMVRERDHDKTIDLDTRRLYLTEEEIERQFEEQERIKEEQEKKAREKQDKSKDDKSKDEEYIEEEEREEMEKQLEDDYTIVAEISDPEISRKFSALEGFVGNPYVVINKKTSEIRIAGKDQGGKLTLSEYENTQPVPAEVTRMNQDGTQTKETGIRKMMYIGSEKNEAINLEIDGSGRVAVNKVVNPRSNNPVTMPIDTKQTEPTSLEVDEMKKNSEVMDKVMEKLDDMEEKGLLTAQEKEDKLEEISSNSNILEEDLESLEVLEKQKEQEKENEGGFEHTLPGERSHP